MNAYLIITLGYVFIAALYNCMMESVSQESTMTYNARLLITALFATAHNWGKIKYLSTGNIRNKL